MAGLGCGLGLPLLAFIGAVVFLLVREKQRKRNSIIEPNSYNFRPPPAMTLTHPAFRSIPTTRDGSDVASMQTANSPRPETPKHLQSFLDRYQAMNEKTGQVPVHRVELDGSPVTRPKQQMADRAIFQDGNRF